MLTKADILEKIKEGKILIATNLLEDFLNYIETSYPLALADSSYLDFVLYKIINDYDVNYIKYVYKFTDDPNMYVYHSELDDDAVIPQNDFLTELNKQRKRYLMKNLYYNLPYKNDCKLEKSKVKI